MARLGAEYSLEVPPTCPVPQGQFEEKWEHCNRLWFCFWTIVIPPGMLADRSEITNECALNQCLLQYKNYATKALNKRTS